MTENRCGTPPTIANAFYVGVINATVGSTLSLQCYHGYEFDENITQMKTMCTNPGYNWSVVPPCQGMQESNMAAIISDTSFSQ